MPNAPMQRRIGGGGHAVGLCALPLISADLGSMYFSIKKNCFSANYKTLDFVRNAYLALCFNFSGGGPPDPPLQASCIRRTQAGGGGGGGGGGRGLCPLSKTAGSAPTELYRPIRFS